MQQNANAVRLLTFTVTLAANQRTYKLLTQNTAIANAKILSIRTRRAGTNRRSLLGKEIANDANFESAFLTLKKGSEEVWETVPVEHIEKASNVSPETGFAVNWDNIDWNTTQLIIAEGVTVDTGKVFEFTVEYINN